MGMVEPEQCVTMAEVRAGVDEVDRRLSALLAIRFRYMDAAARLKNARHLVRDEARKAEVLAYARANALRERWPADVAEGLWDGLVEASIAYELERFDARGADNADNTPRSVRTS